MSPAPKHSPQQQEQRILRAAVDCIENSSLLDFTMAQISRESGLSMGSVYKHIQSKEDVLIALARDQFAHLLTLFEHILGLPLPMPQRLIALALFAPDKCHCYSFGPHLTMLIGNEALLQRASSHWLQAMMQEEGRIDLRIKQALAEALAAGELQAAEAEAEQLAEEIQVGLWAQCVGFNQVAYQRHARAVVGQHFPLPFPLAPDDPIIRSMCRLLNSYPWRTPLQQQDIVSLCERLQAEGLR